MSSKQKIANSRIDSKSVVQEIRVPRKRANLLLSLSGIFKGPRDTSSNKKKYAY
jgi:hypothetical protein